MFLIIICAGKEPQVDSSIAWRIKGIGIGRNIFKSVDISQLKLAVMAFLEGQELDYIGEKLTEIITDSENSG